MIAPHAEELAPTLSPDDARQLAAVAAGTSATARAYVVTAGGPAVQVDLAPRRPNGDVEHGPRRDALTAERIAAVQDAVDHAAVTGGEPSLLSALGDASRTDAATVVVLSAGLAPGDGWDMRVAGWDVPPTTIAADLAVRGLLPDLRGRDVVLSGLGRTTGLQPDLGVREQTALRADWLAVCAATGARCAVDDGVRPTRPPLAKRPGPVVAVPQVTSVAGPSSTEISLPSNLLFAPDSCTLLDPAGATVLLRGAAGRLRSAADTATISGRTAPAGPGDGVELATCRAAAVAGLLRSSGVPDTAITAVRGDGTRADPPAASRTPDGVLDPARFPALRRVVLTLTPKEPT
ncbi:hypothetical protein [Actinomycetospora atypica]|uniref:OmpA-like domain-containing protein n=1 Tax=Actinomycetospora atypica TaxID=1290095 RepID=A0ABV9YHN8_9PSEU